jgi:multicomponent Na+:H+ antiporter subunit B
MRGGRSDGGGRTMRPAALLLVVVVTIPLLVAVVGLPPHGDRDARVHTHVGARYLERGVHETGMRNMVTAVLLNYRSFDTFVEVVVIFTALVAVLALPRGTLPTAAAAASPAATTTAPVSPVVSFVVRLLAPFLALFALAMLFRGHLTPGGGFQAAAVFGAVFIALVLVMGRASADRWMAGEGRAWLQSVGPLAFALVAWIGWRLTGAFLGYPIGDHAVQEAMTFVLEVAIGVGGGVILARLFLAMEA